MDKVITILALILFTRQVISAAEVRHLELNGAHLIDTSANNYAIADPSLFQNQWKTISVNNNNFVIIRPDCQVISKTAQTLTPVERQTIESARQQLLNIESNSQMMVNQGMKMGVSRYSLLPGSSNIQSTRGTNINFSSFNNNGMSIVKSDEANLSVSKQGMPNNLARIFVNNDLVTFVYLNGEVQMKTTTCLQPAETQLIQQIRAEVRQGEEQFRLGMQQFQQSMQNMQQNLQQNMHNMQHNLQQNMQNMFGNWFPFNNMNNNQMMMNGANQVMGNGRNMMSNGNNQMMMGNMMMNGPHQMMMGGGFNRNNMMMQGGNGFAQQFNPFGQNMFGAGYPFGS